MQISSLENNNQQSCEVTCKINSVRAKIKSTGEVIDVTPQNIFDCGIHCVRKYYQYSSDGLLLREFEYNELEF